MRLITVTSLVLVVSFAKGRMRSSSECCTDECYHVAQYYQDHMDTSVDPCTDFYGFACGRFSKGGSADSNVFTQVANVTVRRLRKMVSRDASDDDSVPLQKAKQFYSACMNDERQQTDPIYPIYEKISELGGWPRSEDDGNPNDPEYLIPLVQKSREMGFDTSSLFAVNIVPNIRDTSERILVITPPSLVVPPNVEPSSPQAEKLVNDYSTLMLLIGFQFLEYGDSDASDEAQVKVFKRIVEILKFELLLAKIFPKTYREKDVFETYDVQTISDVQNSYPFINWLEFIQTVLGTTTTVDWNEKLILSGTSYFESLQRVYKALKNKRVVKDYMVWKYILFSLRVSMVMAKEARWKGCLAVTLAGFEPIIAAKYIQSYFSEAEKEPVVDMVNRINQVMHRTFQKYDWIDSTTKEHVLEKIDAIVMRVAYTDDIKNSETTQSQWYNSLSIDQDDYYGSAMNLIKLILDKIAVTLHECIDRNQWPSYISTMSVNAYYVPIENSISIPAALLQKELYSADRPHYLNYGSVGFVIGHELSHAFDNMGRFYDKYGNRNKSLWDADTTAAYKERERCYINQYDKYMLGKSGIHLNGKLTLGENMADNEGIAMAYNAYKTWVKENGPEDSLPGLNYTPEQMFWISMANVWCSRINESTLKKLSRIDPHAPAKLRVIGMVSNQDAFSRDFNCAVGSPMNPRTKCTFD